MGVGGRARHAPLSRGDRPYFLAQDSMCGVVVTLLGSILLVTLLYGIRLILSRLDQFYIILLDIKTIVKILFADSLVIDPNSID